jgi:arylsulfatase A-like enzyme
MTNRNSSPGTKSRGPNVIFVFADQFRRQATGFGGEVNIQTPHMDRLAGESFDFVNAISGTPVCCPARASLLTGQYPHEHGVIINDVPLDPEALTMGKLFGRAGYDTAYIGKWHVNAGGRSAPIPRERQHGFEYWKVLECTHDYNASNYYEGTSTELKTWEGYDAIAQTQDAIRYIRSHDKQKPFLLTLSWGPPHDPYETAPERYMDRVDESSIVLRDNVPADKADEARRLLKGYYAHILALDDCLGSLMENLEETGLFEDTIVVFWSDHGDMLLSHGEPFKQRPWEESIRVPLLIRYPGKFGRIGRKPESFINTPDLLPTLLGLCGIPIPESISGSDYSAYISSTAGGEIGPEGPSTAIDPPADSVLLACHSPFGQYARQEGGREYRGIRTARYTYVRDLNGPWLLYDNDSDPFQMNNLAKEEAHAELIRQLDAELDRKLADHGDALVPGNQLLEKFGYADQVDETGTMPYEAGWE